jgi:hypothetical protein
MIGVKLHKKNRQRFGERNLEIVCNEILNSVPRDRIKELVQGRIDEIQFTELAISEMEEEHLKLEEALYAILVKTTEENDEKIREAINRNMRRLNSPVRLRKPKPGRNKSIKKELDPNIEWGSDPLESFNVSDPTSPLRVQARQQAGQIFSHIAATERDMILAQVELGFTQIQTFNTGRTVTGRTVAQTARGIFPILQETTSGLTAESVALYRTEYTNGLFPRWANAVNNYADKAADDLTRKGITGDRAKELIDKRTKRYGDKLRRSRARMIARTETTFAQASARQIGYEAGLNSGLYNSTSRKRWLTAPFDVCNICAPLSGKSVPMKSFFYWSGGFRGGSGLGEPAHPNCRCETAFEPEIIQPPQLIGANTPNDPFRYQFADGFVAGVNPVAV